jgi:Putative auto-transporter adhesin, head GIN domain
MKFKFSIILLFFVAQQVSSQSLVTRNPGIRYPILTHDAISGIEVSGNIDVVLIPCVPEAVGVKMAPESLGKIKVSLFDDQLYLSTTEAVGQSERVKVYVSINEVSKLKLQGNSSAMSTNLLNTSNLQVYLSPQAKLDLRTDHEVTIHGKSSYDLSEQQGYFSVFTKDRNH